MCVCRHLRVFDGVADRKAFSSLNVPQARSSSRGRQPLSGASGRGLLTRLPSVNGHSVRLLRPRTISLIGALHPVQSPDERN